MKKLKNKILIRKSYKAIPIQLRKFLLTKIELLQNNSHYDILTCSSCKNKIKININLKRYNLLNLHQEDGLIYLRGTISRKSILNEYHFSFSFMMLKNRL